MKQLVILAGGKGTRLRERLGDLPKPLIDICGKPLLEHQIVLAKKYGFEDIILLIGYGAAAIRDFCKDGKQWGVNIRYVEEVQPLGTAGAVLAALDELDEHFLVMYGDTMLNIDLERLWHVHLNHGVDATLLLHPNDHPQDSDLVDIDDKNFVTHFYPYPHPEGRYYPNLVNAALYILEKNALKSWQHETQALDFGKNLFPAMLQAGKRLYGYNSPEYIKDAGTPKRLDKVCADFKLGKIQQSALDVTKQAIFIDRDGTINEKAGYVKAPDEFNLIADVAESIKKINDSAYLAVVISNQPVIARGDCSFEQLKQIHNKMETQLAEVGAYVDSIYFCPHHPDKGFPHERPEFKIVCDCRKPAIGMIKKAQQNLNIDLSKSWFIGDTTTDIQTAKNAQVKSILLHTGERGLDRRYHVHADYQFFSLSEAVEFILKRYPKMHEKATKLAKKILPGNKILIGGLARSGKSTWARVLQEAVLAQGLECIIVSLDGWIEDINSRDNTNVLTRHNSKAITHFVDQLVQVDNTIKFEIPCYNRQIRSPNEAGDEVEINKNTVIIFEGVIALLHEKLLAIADHSIFVDSDEISRKQNIIKDYSLRGFALNDIETLYLEREQDETPLIRASHAAASITLIGY